MNSIEIDCALSNSPHTQRALPWRRHKFACELLGTSDSDLTTCDDACLTVAAPTTRFLYHPYSGAWFVAVDAAEPETVTRVVESLVRIAVLNALRQGGKSFTAYELRLAMDLYKAAADCTAIWNELNVVTRERRTQAQTVRS